MIRSITQTILKLILKPRGAWKELSRKEEKLEDFYNTFLYPLFGFITVTTFVGAMWIRSGGGVPFALRDVVVVLTSLFGGFHIGAYVLDEIYQKYVEMRDERQIRLFVGYSSVVVYLLYLIMPLLPGMELLWLLIVYTFYLVKEGVIHFLKLPEDKQSSFVLISLALVVLLPIIISSLLGVVIK